MKYKEKIKLAEDYLNQLRNGLTEDEISEALINDGVPNYNVVKIKSAALKMLHDEYGEKIRKYLLADELANHLEEFELVDDKTFEDIQHKEVANIKAKCDAEVSKLYRAGKTADEMADLVGNDYYDIDDVINHIDKYQYHNEVNKDQGLMRLGGILAIALGLVMTLMSKDSGGDSIRIFYGIVIVGIIMLFKSGLTQAELDKSK